MPNEVANGQFAPHTSGIELIYSLNIIKDMAISWLAAPCGLYCGECFGFQRGTCKGCRSGVGECLKYRKICRIYECCIVNRKFDFCNQCHEFPCKRFNEFFETPVWYSEVVNNLERIKEVGVEKWLKEEEARVKSLKECASQKGITHCNECKDWPCEKLKRPPLTPA